MVELQRTAFKTSRLLDFATRKELIAQTGHQPDAWPLVVLKELLDNAIDACEDAGVAPTITVTVTNDAITVADNGPGISPEIVAGVLDFAVRVSSREAYVSPTRGAQGNALKTVVAMPYVLDGDTGSVEISAHGVRHRITMQVDRIRQQPIIGHAPAVDDLEKGTAVCVRWPEKANQILGGAGQRFLQIADDYTYLNPHLTLAVDWLGTKKAYTQATDPAWKKWLPSHPTSPHWYKAEHLERLVAAYITDDADNGRTRTVREIVSEFHGLTGTSKQKAVLEATGLSRAGLTALSDGNRLRPDLIASLLDAMQKQTRPVNPEALGSIGKEHLRARLLAEGAKEESIQYIRKKGESDDVPWIIEACFGYCPNQDRQRLITGVNWSPGILNPFRELGKFGSSLDEVLTSKYAGRHEPIALVLHIVCPRVEYTDRGKSAVVIAGCMMNDREEVGDE